MIVFELPESVVGISSFWKMLGHYFKHLFDCSLSLFYFWYLHYIHVIPSDIVPESMDVLFCFGGGIFFILFSLCISILAGSIELSSGSLIISSVILVYLWDHQRNSTCLLHWFWFLDFLLIFFFRVSSFCLLPIFSSILATFFIRALKY